MKTEFIEAYGGVVSPADGYRRQKTICGLSTDIKPTKGCNNADIFYEMDTKKVYMFDEENGAWLEQ